MRDAEPELARLLVEHRAGHQLRQHLLVDAERLRLFARQPLAEALRHHVDLPVVGETIVCHGHRGFADANDTVPPKPDLLSLPEMPQTAKLMHQKNAEAPWQPRFRRLFSVTSSIVPVRSGLDRRVTAIMGNNALRRDVSIALWLVFGSRALTAAPRGGIMP